MRTVVRACGSLSGRGPAAQATGSKISDSDRRVVKCRAALDAGAEPAVVAGRMAQVQGDRLRTEAELTR